MIWYMVAFLCAVSAFAEFARNGQYFMAWVMVVSGGVCIFGILTS